MRGLRKQWEPLLELKKEVSEYVSLADIAETEEEKSELEAAYERLWKTWLELEQALYLGGKYDLGDAYLSITSGAGGTEAQDWAAMLMRMYLRYAERKGWKTDLIEKTDGQEAGIKSATVHVKGDSAYGLLKNERGTHRLVRLSPFNAKNLRQTSFALVEVLPDMAPHHHEYVLKPEDLRIDTFRAGGAGGQHVNKTDSAVRITHLPTGLVVACQNERSQLQNRERAMALLKAKLHERDELEAKQERDRLKGATKSADFGSQIRSYVLHPYQMVKDLRTHVETSDTEGVLDGDLDHFVEAELKRSARE